jgi:hypothetical protein
MDQQVERWQCQRCDVTYRIKKHDPRCEEFRCSTPNCGKRFWTGQKTVSGKLVCTMNMEVRPA